MTRISPMPPPQPPATSKIRPRNGAHVPRDHVLTASGSGAHPPACSTGVMARLRENIDHNRAVAGINYTPAAWESAIWDEGDIEGAPLRFLFEFNAAGEVLRQVELVGPEERPIAAASLEEFWAAQEHTAQAETPVLRAYRERYGSVAEGRRADWDESYPGRPISQSEFEA